ncbi:MAG: MFS transporter [Alphaproteobacteria bacterium]|nr:MFS transporter [Alphaproteobacteria bacterium]
MTRTRDGVILAALWALNFATSVQFLIVAPILPRIGEQLDVPEASLGAVVTAYAVGFGIAGLLAGPISDWAGRRKVLVVGSGAMALALLAHGVTTTFAGLLAARFAGGLAAGALSGSSVAYVGDAFPYERRGWANGWIASSFAAGQILGIPSGALLADLGYQTPFAVFGIIATLAFLLIRRVLPEPDVELVPELSVRGILRQYADLLRLPIARRSVLAYVFLFAGVAVFVTHLPAWLEQTFDVGSAAVASLFMVGGLSNLIVGPQAGALSDRVGRKVLVSGGSLANAVIMAITPLVVVRFELAYVTFFVVMIFVALRVSPQQSLISSLVPARQRGTLMSVCLSVGQMVGFGLGGLASGVLYEGPWGFQANALAGGLLSGTMGLLVWFGLPEPDGSQERA